MEQKSDSVVFVFNKPIEIAEMGRLALFIKGILKLFKAPLERLTFVFTSDEDILTINQKYLKHDYYTDIITFDYRESESEPLNSDIYISLDTVSSNADLQKTLFDKELHRVMFHGVLHLVGFNDKTEEEALEMRRQEEKLLSEYFG